MEIKTHKCNLVHTCFDCGSLIAPSPMEKHHEIIKYESFKGLFICSDCLAAIQGSANKKYFF